MIRCDTCSIVTGTSPLFIGRAQEFGRLVKLLERAERGDSAVALIAGDAGVGKTRLLAELAASAKRRSMRVLVGGCMETGDVGLPYVPFIDAFRDVGSHPEDVELANSLIRVVPNLGRLITTVKEERVSAPPSNDEFEQVELFGGVLSFLVTLSERVPVLLVIEDLHWADRSTRDLFAFLARTLRSSRVALIASYRSDELHRRHPLRPFLGELVRFPGIERMELAPFSRKELSEHLEALVGVPVDGFAVDRILARSEGNAFFAEELVAAGATRAEVVLPEALADVLRQRIEVLSEPAQELLKLASVAGSRVTHDLLVAAAGRSEGEVEAGVREAITSQVMVADPVTQAYRFRHALLQETVYGDLLPGERTRLHAAYARLLAVSGPAAELAHHCLASHDLPGALEALVRAADEATAVSASAEALSHLSQAIDLWEQVPDAAAATGVDRVGLLMKAAAAAGTSGEFRRAVALAQEAVNTIDEDNDPLRAGLAQLRLGEHLYQTSNLDEGPLSALRRAVELVPAEPPSALRARVTEGLARGLLGASQYEEARKWCDEALAIAQKADAADEEIHSLITLAVLEQRHDNPDVARSLLRDAKERAATVGARAQELRSQYSLGALDLDVGNLPAACIALEAAIAQAEQTGLRWSQYGINSKVLLAYANYAAGEWDEAERLAATLDDRMPGMGSLSAVALFVNVGRGRPEATDRLQHLETRWREDDWVGYLGGGCGIDFALWKGDLDGARDLTRRTLSMLDAADEAWELSAIWPAALGLAVEAERAHNARIAGDEATVADARAAGEALLERCRVAEREAQSVGRQIGPEAVAWLARASAEWSRVQGDTDPDLWAASAEAFAYGHIYEEARSRWRLAEALLAHGRREEATEPARAAYATALQLGASPLREHVEAVARRGRLDIGSDVAPSEGAAGLTPRELEVLRLVADGRSNQQIADALFISRKTASVHVSHILAKLSVHTRVEAAAFAHRLGLDDVGPSKEATPTPAE